MVQLSCLIVLTLISYNYYSVRKIKASRRQPSELKAVSTVQSRKILPEHDSTGHEYEKIKRDQVTEDVYEMPQNSSCDQVKEDIYEMPAV